MDAFQAQLAEIDENYIRATSHRPRRRHTAGSA